jgi:hypothetical protein
MKLRDVFNRPSAKVRAMKTPIRNEPLMLMTMVPHGNFSPHRSPTTFETQNRLIPPSALPTATQK